MRAKSRRLTTVADKAFRLHLCERTCAGRSGKPIAKSTAVVQYQRGSEFVHAHRAVTDDEGLFRTPPHLPGISDIASQSRTLAAAKLLRHRRGRSSMTPTPLSKTCVLIGTKLSNSKHILDTARSLQCLRWALTDPTVDAPWNLRRAVHLHRRAVFGACWSEIQRDLAGDPQAAVSRVLDGRLAREASRRSSRHCRRSLVPQRSDSGNADRLKAWWLYRCLFSPHPLEERLTLMWHNHFATSNLKVNDLPIDAAAERHTAPSTPSRRFPRHAARDGS